MLPSTDRPPRRTRRLLPLVVLLLGSTAATAHANPLTLARFGGLRGDPLYTGAWATYWNPAALARPGLELGLHAQIPSRAATYYRDARLNGLTGAEAVANSGLARVGTTSVMPGLAARYGRSVGRGFDLGAGVAVYVGHGGAANWERNLGAPSQYPGAVDGPQRWSTINTRLFVINAAFALAARHRPSGLSIGFAPVLAAARFALVRAANLDRSEDLVDSAGNLKEGRAYFEGDALALQWNVGVRWDITPRYALGLTWHRGASFGLEGTLRVAFGTQPPTREPARLGLPVADTFRLGAALAVLPRLTLRPQVEWARWSVLQRMSFVTVDDGGSLIDVERDFHDSVAGRLRADVRVWRRLVLMAGVGYEWGPTPLHAHDPGLSEGDSVELGLGAVLDVVGPLRLSASYIWNYFLPRTVTNSVGEPPTNGRYTDQRHYLLIDVELRWL